MTVSHGPAVCAALLLVLGLAACATAPAQQQTQLPAPLPPALTEIETALASEIAPVKAVVPPPSRPAVQPAWVKRIETKGGTNPEGKTDLSLASVQPLYQGARKADTVFTQVRVDGSPQTADPAGTSNIGLGYRRLVDKDLLVGVNGFYDRDWAQTLERAGADAEIKWKAFDMAVNYYGGLSGGGETQKRALDGYNLELGSQIPYLPWAQAKFANTDFFTENRTVTHSYSAGMKFDLMKYVQLDMGLRGNADAAEAGIVKLNFNLLPSQWGPQRRYAFGSTPIADTPFESRDMRPHTLDKVRRIDTIQSDG
jgi:hypothetical protein